MNIKNVLLASLLIGVFGCKTDQKKTTKKEITIKEVVEIPISEATIPDFYKWTKNQITFLDQAYQFNDQKVYLMSRNDVSKPAFASFQNVKINLASTYKMSVIVKKGVEGKDFAIRAQAVYPNRVDAIFDLEEGKVVNTKISGKEFAENEKATIESLGDGWYKCSISADLYSDSIRIVFGPTNADIIIGSWERKTEAESNVYIIPSSLKIEEF